MVHVYAELDLGSTDLSGVRHLSPSAQAANKVLIFDTLRSGPGEYGSMAITKIDNDGGVLLPPDLLYKLSLKDGDKLEVDELKDGTLLLRKVKAPVAVDTMPKTA
ncbi:MAG: AbrB/MazE/SpoVT family DNA-binding domain-containing protein [Phycisphaerales bacterium]